MSDMFQKHNDNMDEFCMSCGSSPCTTDCPKHLVDDIPNSEIMRSIFFNYLPNVDLMNQSEIAESVGKHLLLISDAVLEAQRKWENKTFMNKLDEVMTDYPTYIEFTKSLHKAGAFDSIDDIIEFISFPKKWNKLFNYWYEVYYPIITKHKSQKDTMWEIFKEKVLEHKNLINGV